MSADEQRKLAAIMFTASLMDYLFSIYEDMYYQHVEGQRNPRVWGGFEAIMRDIVAYPAIPSTLV